VDLSHFVGFARIEKNTLGYRRFAGVDMSYNPDIA
jgi:hypothetical protein